MATDPDAIEVPCWDARLSRPHEPHTWQAVAVDRAEQVAAREEAGAIGLYCNGYHERSRVSLWLDTVINGDCEPLVPPTHRAIVGIEVHIDLIAAPWLEETETYEVIRQAFRDFNALAAYHDQEGPDVPVFVTAGTARLAGGRLVRNPS